MQRAPVQRPDGAPVLPLGARGRRVRRHAATPRLQPQPPHQRDDLRRDARRRAVQPVLVLAAPLGGLCRALVRVQSSGVRPLARLARQARRRQQVIGRVVQGTVGGGG